MKLNIVIIGPSYMIRNIGSATIVNIRNIAMKIIGPFIMSHNIAITTIE